MFAAVVEGLRAENAALKERVEILEELFTRNQGAKYGAATPNVEMCLRSYADRVRATSGFDPGAAYDKHADDIRAALHPTEPKEGT